MVLVCQPCNKRFSRLSSFYRHQRETKTHRAGGITAQPQYRCANCSKSFTRDFDRRRHERERTVNGRCLSPSCRQLSRRKMPLEMNQGVPSQNLSVAAHIGDQDMPEVVRLVERPTIRRRTMTEAKPWTCGICHAGFAIDGAAALFDHLKNHFSAATGGHPCEECQINFTYEADLLLHRVSAQEGHCGYRFCDRTKCTGHHPSGRDRLIMLNVLRNWEQCQLQAYIRSVTVLGSKSVGRLFTESEPDNRCLACKILPFFQKAFPDEHPNCYLEHLKSHRWSNAGPSFVEQAMTATETDALVRTLTGRYRRSSSVEATTSIDGSLSDVKNEKLRDSKQLKHAMSNLQDSAFIDVSYLSNPLQGTLHLSAGLGDWALVDTCISRGADVLGVDLGGRTAVHWAAASGSSQTVELLLERGGGLDPRDTYDHTPLHVAIEHQHLECANLLLKYGADAKAVDSDKRTCLHLVVESGDIEIVQLLLNYDCNLEARDLYGGTPLHRATGKGNLDLVEALCNAGAHIDHSSEYQGPPLRIAIDAKNFQIARYFLQQGALATADMVPFARKRGADDSFMRLLQSQMLSN